MLLIAFLLGWVVGGGASHSLFTGVGGGWRVILRAFLLGWGVDVRGFL